MILQRKKQKVKVTAFKNTAILVVKKARTGLIADSMKKGSIPYRKATEDSKYHNFIKCICCKAFLFFLSLCGIRL